MSIVHYGSGGTGTADTKVYRSASLWAGCPEVEELQTGPRHGWRIYDDFTESGLITSATTEAAVVGTKWSMFGSSGATWTWAAEQGGVVKLTEATDNEAVYLRSGVQPFQISSHLGKLWFEARVKVNAITDDQIGFILGLIDSTAATVVVPLSTANPPVLDGCNFVGFHGREQDAGMVSTYYIADTVTPVAVKSNGVHQFVADTYVKLGMLFDPLDSNKLSFWVNGVKQPDTKTVPNNTGTDFPADVQLGPIFGHRLGASTSSISSIDWVECVQLSV